MRKEVYCGMTEQEIRKHLISLRTAFDRREIKDVVFDDEPFDALYKAFDFLNFGDPELAGYSLYEIYKGGLVCI